MSLSKKKIYLGFFIIYYTISIFDALFIIYIPLYYLNILSVDRVELSLIQGLTYLTLLVTPLLGFLYDRYLINEIQSKMILCLSCIILSISFLIFIFFKELLLLYGIFMIISLFSKSLIRTGMSSLFLNVVKESEDIKLNVILLVNTATIVGYLGISLIFNLEVLNINSLRFWNTFFIIGWILSLPIFIIFGIFANKVQYFSQTINIQNKSINNLEFKLSRYEFILIGVIYFSSILATSDLLISYPLSSWIYDKFNETGFRIYSSLYFIFILCSILGLYLANFLCKKYREKKVMVIFTYIYSILLLPITISNFPMFMIINSILSVISYVITVAYTSLITEFSNKGKYRTFKYQFLQTSSSMACIFFIPLGTLYFGTITVETLIIISSILIGFSGFFLLSTVPIDKIIDQKKREIIIEETIDVIS
ncbi:MAG: MFS transporter [Promethearchaeota archaeon]